MFQVYRTKKGNATYSSNMAHFKISLKQGRILHSRRCIAIMQVGYDSSVISNEKSAIWLSVIPGPQEASAELRL